VSAERIDPDSTVLYLLPSFFFLETCVLSLEIDLSKTFRGPQLSACAREGQRSNSAVPGFGQADRVSVTRMYSGRVAFVGASGPMGPETAESGLCLLFGACGWLLWFLRYRAW
jgi:hypothetical protein